MVDWPESAVPLYVPKEWETTRNASNPETCQLTYDAASNLLKLVSNESKTPSGDPLVIDVLDPEDIVGVHVEIDMALASATPRVTDATTNNNSGRDSNAPATDTPTDTQGHAVLNIYAYPRDDPNNPVESSSLSILRWCGLGSTHPKPNPKYKRPDPGTEEWQKWGNRYAFHRRFTVVASEDVGPLNALVRAIRQAAQLKSAEERGRALVMVNPKSGPKCNAEQLYEDIVNIVFDQASLDHDLCVTGYARHAEKRMAKGYSEEDDAKDISQYTAIICMGGDGIMHECLQGIKDRDDWQEIFKKISFGIIGAGTSNGMAASIAKSSQQKSSILDASYLIAKGYTKPTDISLYQTPTKSYFSFLTFSWAMMSSIDIESGKF